MSTPTAVRSNIATTAVAASMTTRGTGTRGNRGVSTRSSTATVSPMATVGQDTPTAALPANEPMSSRKESPATSTPVTLPSWLVIMMTATPAMYPMSTGRESRSPMNPSFRIPETIA